MVWLSHWLRVRVLRWLGIQAALDAVIARAVKEVREADARAMKEAAYAHEHIGKTLVLCHVLASRADGMESAARAQSLRLQGLSERLVDLETAPKPEVVRAIDEQRRGGWETVRAQIEAEEMRLPA